MNIPVLILIFNRPDKVRSVLCALKAVRPTKLYVAADGPRISVPGEVEKCEQARAMVNVDWPCEVHTLFRDENLGCARNVGGAIRWFFEQEHEGIVLEDDLVPHPDFFLYCEELLERYRSDDQVAYINGTHYNVPAFDIEESYFFSAVNHSCGWASWSAKLLPLFNLEMRGITLPLYKKALRRYGLSYWERIYWLYWFLVVKMQLKRNVSSWSFPMSASLHMAGKLSVMPNKLLLENVGFDAESTHTTARGHFYEGRKAEPILPLVHPQKVHRHAEFDRYYGRKRMFKWRFVQRVWVNSIKYYLRGIKE